MTMGDFGGFSAYVIDLPYRRRFLSAGIGLFIIFSSANLVANTFDRVISQPVWPPGGMKTLVNSSANGFFTLRMFGVRRSGNEANRGSLWVASRDVGPLPGFRDRLASKGMR